MKSILTASLFALSASVFAGTTPHWTYEGKAGPENWGELSNEFAT
ncbi:carbonic anhydrase, partial [Enterobacter cloacae]|nr:carbonic anhydrase [Enterobacter cloacae]